MATMSAFRMKRTVCMATQNIIVQPMLLTIGSAALEMSIAVVVAIVVAFGGGCMAVIY